MTLRSATLVQAQVTPETDWLFLGVCDGEGRTGWGECTLGGRADAVTGAARQMLPDLLGTEPAAAALIDRLPARDMASAAICSSLAQAVRDLDAQAAGVPLFKTLGGSTGKAIDLYANINRRNRDRQPATMAESAQLARQAGFSAIKIAPFDEVRPTVGRHGLAEALAPGLARIDAVRAAAGPDTRLMIDCHWRFNRQTAAEMIRSCAGFDPWWIECPVAETPDLLADIKALRRLGNGLGIRLAGLEQEIGLAGFQPYLDAGAYDVMMPDVKYVGGPDEMIRVSETLAKAGVGFSPHNPSGPICHMHSLHVCAAIEETDLLECQFDETPLFSGIVTPSLPDAGAGQAVPSDLAGLGIALDSSAFAFKTLFKIEGLPE